MTELSGAPKTPQRGIDGWNSPAAPFGKLPPLPTVCKLSHYLFPGGVAAFFLKLRLLPCLLLILTAGLCSCVSMLAGGPAPARLHLEPRMPSQSAGIALNKQLVIALPAAGRDIDTDNIALVFKNREIRYLSGVRWTSPAPNILQRSLIDALTATKSLRGVTDESAGILADAKLLCDLRQFSLHYPDSEGAPTAVITGIFRLLNLSDGSIMDVLRVHVEVPANDHDMAALALACETALGRCLAEVAPWVIQTMARSR